MKQPNKSTVEPESTGDDVDAGSGVQVSRRALYDQRLAEITADIENGVCTPDEAGERLVTAVMGLTGHVFNRAAKNEVESVLKRLCTEHPGLRQLLGR